MRPPTFDRQQVLVRALELMGFDADAVVSHILGAPSPAQVELALRSVRVCFDDWSARRLEPGLSPEDLDVVHAWFEAVRRGPQRPPCTQRPQAERRAIG